VPRCDVDCPRGCADQGAGALLAPLHASSDVRCAAKYADEVPGLAAVPPLPEFLPLSTTAHLSITDMNISLCVGSYLRADEASGSENEKYSQRGGQQGAKLATLCVTRQQAML